MSEQDRVAASDGDLPQGHPGWRCANPECARLVRVDHIVVVTTWHARRFCTMECIIEGYRAHIDRILEDVHRGRA